MKKQLRKTVLVILILILLLPLNGLCMEEYAKQTGKGCAECHKEATGGPELTQEGEAFKNDLRLKGLYRPLSKTQQWVRFFIGYLHLLTAIMWFGTILYVHIILKPAYAARGLPKSELTLGWISIFIMAITGTLLSIARIPSWEALFHTRFGILLTIKVILFLVMVSTAVFVTFAVGPRLRKTKQRVLALPKKELTPEELSHFDGKDGRPAYIAYQGDIYDVSKNRFWKGGSHFKKHFAGFDLTEALGSAPHGEDKVLNMSPIGKLLKEGKAPKPLAMKIFYFFAYMNLVLVFSIVFIVSLWRWQ